MKAVCSVMLLSLLALQGADAMGKFIRGSNELKVDKMFDDVKPAAEGAASAGYNWKSLGLGAGIGAVVIGALVFVILKFALAPAKDEEAEKEGEEAAAAVATEEVTEEEIEAVDTAATDYQALLKVLAQKVAQEVGPKVSKCAAVSSVLESRMSSFTDKAKDFLLKEMNGTAGAVLREMDAPETMLLLDWNHAVEANFPPASILIAGVLSPTVLNIMSMHHFIQMVSVGLPILILCVLAIVIDWSQPCSIPTIYEWLFTQTALAALLVLGHGALLFKVWLGKRSLVAKAEEVAQQNAGSDNQVRDEFVGGTIVLQEALLVENDIRRSFWNNVVGLATFGWVISTIWNLVLVVGWTFVPGVVAFHPAAAEVAKGEYCGAWMTVLVMKINVLLAVLFLFLNLATVAKWFCDCMIESQGFQKFVLDQAKAMDRNATGLPVMELLVKAFLLRGGSDTLNSRLSVVQNQKALYTTEEAALEAQLAAVTSELESVGAEETTIKANAKETGGELASQVSALIHSSEEVQEKEGRQAKLAELQAKLAEAGIDVAAAEKLKEEIAAMQSKALAEAEERARAVQEATTKAIEELWEKIMAAVEAVQNSETAKALIAKAHEAEAILEAKMQEAMATVQDPEFLNKLNEAAQQATAQAKELADSAIAAAKDPEAYAKLKAQAQEAMDQAQKAAEELAAAANDPEKRAELQAKAQQAMEQAQAAAVDAANAIQDPEIQRKMKEAAQNAMDQAQLAAQSAIAAAQDPELANKLKEQANKAMEDAKAAAQKAADAANDPELKAKLEEAAKKAMQDAQEAAQAAKAAAQDPELQKKIAEAAQKYADDAKSAATGSKD